MIADLLLKLADLVNKLLKDKDGRFIWTNIYLFVVIMALSFICIMTLKKNFALIKELEELKENKQVTLVSKDSEGVVKNYTGPVSSEDFTISCVKGKCTCMIDGEPSGESNGDTQGE